LKIALVRHPAALIAPGLCYGRTDIPLRTESIAALPEMAGRLAGFAAQAVWSSPAARCVVTSEFIARDREVRPCVDARLLELDFGTWEGRNWDAVPRDELDRWADDPLVFAPPGGETGAALIARVKAFHRDLLARARDCIVVSHGGPLKVLSALLLNTPIDLLAPPPGLGSITIVAC
jgi:alpha-ribazole phosphatase